MGAEEGIRTGINNNEENKLRLNFKDNVIKALGTEYDNPIIRDFVNSASTNDLINMARESGLLDETKTLFGTSDKLRSDTYTNVAQYLAQLEDLYAQMPTEQDAIDAILSGEDPVSKAYLGELAKSEERQTANFQNQLQENQMMFDDYRSQILGNQYQQNAQLMGSVDSAMSKARRNALEAGASAGLRMAENINTTLALQNKQAQTSLETSNQLAQQLLNQRQAAAGIRSDYNTMLDNNSAERRNYVAQRTRDVHDSKMSDWHTRFDNSSNPYAGMLKSNIYKTEQDKKVNPVNKQTSQYN